MEASLYEAIGGAEGCRALATAFYARVARDPVLRPLFPGKTLRCAMEEFAAYLAQLLGGPEKERQRRWWVSLRESHQRFRIEAREREAWLGHMRKTLEEVEMEDWLRKGLDRFFAEASGYVVNQRGAPGADSGMPVELARRWETQRQLDEAVAALRRGDVMAVAAITEKGNFERGLMVGLLAQVIRSGRGEFIGFVRQALAQDAGLVEARYGGRTLAKNI